MNLEQLKKNKGWRVQLLPIASRLDDGSELPRVDDDWIIEEVSNSEVSIFNPRTQHRLALGADHVHHFTMYPEASNRC